MQPTETSLLLILEFNPLFTHCRTVHLNNKYLPSLLTSGLNRTKVYAAFKKSRRAPIG